MASQLNLQRETDKLLDKIDTMSDDLTKTQLSRTTTKLAANADRENKGRPVELGSWGFDPNGNVVTVDTTTTDAGRKELLGSVGSTVAAAQVARKKKKARLSSSSPLPDEEVGIDAVLSPHQNKVLVLINEKEDVPTKKIITQFKKLLSEQIQGKSISVQFHPSSTPAPLGGLDAQCVILVASTINGRFPVESILSHLLRRTAQPGGTFSEPPTHFVILSSLGTERTDTMPFSMQNLFTGKLNRPQEVEESAKAVVCGRIPGDQLPLDYTILKWGDILDDDKNNNNHCEPFNPQCTRTF